MIVITGATGFVGLYTTQAFLEAGYEVVGLGRNPVTAKMLQAAGAKFIEFDVTDEKAFERLPASDVEGVVHLAAFMPADSTVDLSFDESALECLNTNVMGTARVLEYCRKNGINKVIGARGHRDISGAFGKVEAITEDEPRSFSLLGDHATMLISENAATDMMEYYNQQHGMQCAWFRLPRTYGIGPHNMNYFYSNGQKRIPGVAAFIKQARDGKDLELWGNPRSKNDLVYVKDVAQAYVKAMKSNHTLGLYNISGHMQVTLEDQAKAVISVFGDVKKSHIVYQPQKQVYQRKPYLYSIDKARRDFGYEPRYTDFVKIMEDYKRELDSGKWDEWLASRK